VDLVFDNTTNFQKFIELDLIKTLKLSKSISTKNYHLFNQKGIITHYKDAEEILLEFIKIRIEFNIKRKGFLLEKYLKDLTINENKIRFLSEIMNEKLIIYKKTKKQIEELLIKSEYLKIDESYNYLTNLPIYSFTKEQLDKLEKEINVIKEKYNTIKETSEKQMLNNDIRNLEQKN